MIELRNPIYKVKEHDTASFKRLKDKDLVGIDLRINGDTLAIRKKQKYIVVHMKDLWWIGNENFVEPPYVNLYSVNDIAVNDGKFIIKFCYQNGRVLELKEEEIISLVPVRKKSKREDKDIQQLLIPISE